MPTLTWCQSTSLKKLLKAITIKMITEATKIVLITLAYLFQILVNFWIMVFIFH
ncbi:hypothetical protein FC35_GL001282 [Limosilactobacillus coleohominis DSM 14060]|nr:hypothetical protein FC35_GL001282 [Limosilactobacillus coleohominis DSM 14060]